MVDKHLSFETHLSKLSKNAWLSEVDDICDDHGFFEQLGSDHFAGFLEAGNNLLVTFEDIEKVQSQNARSEPRGFTFSRHEGWSYLAIFSSSESWFRDPAVFDFFDRLVDDGFFEDFEKIVFYGAHGGGYAAAAFSVAAPGSTVIALRPQATLDAATTNWDPRYRKFRSLDFSGRYAYAPEMIEGAEQVFIAYDSTDHLDAAHAALFRQPHVTMVRCPLMGTNLDQTFDRLGILNIVIKLAMDGSLNHDRFQQLLRSRRYDDTYAIGLIEHLVRSNHMSLARIICEYKAQRSKNPFYKAALKDLKRADRD
ncbi:hypothetical protein [Loktanella sp. S4079]|uniref:hypothetical protein n=1 Tax=Loktanella sp. S4079 TaxID=579483 RepID=UPI0005FA7306|nr:hypothetical protein [Loktanella sp. S4079]KJZ19903.1 hypothetical protein TW80_03260 [Loktanella sp. S4079]